MRDMFEIGAVLRDTVAAFYDDPDNGLIDTGSALPARRLVTFGLPAADCEVFAVAVESMNPIAGSAAVSAVADDRDEVGFYMRSMVVGLWVLRCVPPMLDDGSPPTTDDEEASAMDVLLDAKYLELAVREALAARELPGCGGIAFIGWESVTPSGELGGGVVRLNISLE